jgi:hypothetical protein
MGSLGHIAYMEETINSYALTGREPQGKRRFIANGRTILNRTLKDMSNTLNSSV